MRIHRIILVAILLIVAGSLQAQSLKVHEGKRYFTTENGKPFFWLGDTGWLLWVKCNREDVQYYLDTRKQQGFNLIQVMGLHELKSARNTYGDSALIGRDVSKPLVTPGNDPSDAVAYDYWDHVEFVIQEAAKRNLYIGYVPVWGSNVKEGLVTASQARVYANFLADRFGKYKNIVWLNGGDVKGTDGMDVWDALAGTLRDRIPAALITYHPRGRYSSSDFFNDRTWLSFNMIQSGHRNYAQDTSAADLHHFGEDSWRYVQMDWQLKPMKPTMDGEPSYENIPQGLHDYTKPLWNANDIRRYVYWSVFAGGAGVTYGENAVMQFHRRGDADANYNVGVSWKDALQATGATQMKHLKTLLLSHDYFSRQPAQEILYNNNGQRYQYLLATKGRGYAMVYTYTGAIIQVNFATLEFTVKHAYWFDPRTGQRTRINQAINGRSIQRFYPPGETKEGNDWVLVLENK